MERACASATWQTNNYISFLRKSILTSPKKFKWEAACIAAANCIGPIISANPAADPKRASRSIAIVFAVPRKDAGSGIRPHQSVSWDAKSTSGSWWF